MREHQQANRVDVEPARRHQALQLFGVKEKARVVLGPAVLRLHQGDGWQVPVLSLPADDAHGFVDQDGDLVGLLTLRLRADLDAHIGRHLHAHGGRHAVDLDPALADPVVSFTPRGQPQLGHAFVQPQRAVWPDGRGIGLPSRDRRPIGWRRSTPEDGRCRGGGGRVRFGHLL